jgi:hypothetical protein
LFGTFALLATANEEVRVYHLVNEGVQQFIQASASIFEWCDVQLDADSRVFDVGRTRHTWGVVRQRSPFEMHHALQQPLEQVSVQGIEDQEWRLRPQWRLASGVDRINNARPVAGEVLVTVCSGILESPAEIALADDAGLC